MSYRNPIGHYSYKKYKKSQDEVKFINNVKDSKEQKPGNEFIEHVTILANYMINV
jgi:hypothetical protein